MEKKFNTNYGIALIRYAIFDIDGTNLEEGVEINLDGKYIGRRLGGNLDVESMTVKEVEELIENC